MNKNDIIYVVAVFIFLKYGLKQLNLIYFILISIGIVYIIKKNNLLNIKKKDKIEVEDNLNSVLKKIEKYDNNNLFLKIRSNIRNLNRYLTKKNTFLTMDINDIDFIKSKILSMINELNIQHNDKLIDNVYSSVSNILNKKHKLL